MERKKEVGRKEGRNEESREGGRNVPVLAPSLFPFLPSFEFQKTKRVRGMEKGTEGRTFVLPKKGRKHARVGKREGGRREDKRRA